MAKLEPRVIGLSCWQRDNGCRNHFDYTVPRGMKDAEAFDVMEGLAGDAGWVIGHHDGQGHYACPDDAASLFDPCRLTRHRFPVTQQ